VAIRRLINRSQKSNCFVGGESSPVIDETVCSDLNGAISTDFWQINRCTLIGMSSVQECQAACHADDGPRPTLKRHCVNPTIHDAAECALQGFDPLNFGEQASFGYSWYACKSGRSDVQGQ
jgi:hypothetical protein